MRYLNTAVKVVALHVISSFEFAIKMDRTDETLYLLADSHGIIQKKTHTLDFMQEEALAVAIS